METCVSQLTRVQVEVILYGFMSEISNSWEQSDSHLDIGLNTERHLLFARMILSIW